MEGKAAELAGLAGESAAEDETELMSDSSPATKPYRLRCTVAVATVIADGENDSDGEGDGVCSEAELELAALPMEDSGDVGTVAGPFPPAASAAGAGLLVSPANAKARTAAAPAVAG